MNQRLSIILYEPEIPPNTGNIIRLCANSGAELHLIEPLGFSLEEKALRRAGLDYAEWATMKVWPSLSACLEAIAPNQIYAMTTKGSRNFFEARFEPGDALIFGPETRGLPENFIFSLPGEQRLRLPMVENAGRSLNLSNSVAIAVYEAWRQFEFSGD
ncbi:tRNA (cytidine(34)-2'-O)-methyltransferase [Ignatzschineria cameli]|uniref:tRNA (cytidine(34)-2'-O)-methyltransferase n=1 Tax=Ignatzschineria cameli TaxID=2182793 RepID=A0A2U2AKG1_9GAMM|nr:tRNA (cytidine(34)-2'-O)-methyltransferase [Ignatzschineria cameli]PWD83341.1 tRNA (uridine(34)/cytosine(34)/5-carboxymethylaminomethyluridine(34)-2'-O)-methyltransferase TrmL [Ignatzschineria cameli]PWD85697.1 tRNA (uridine(34)/cytosine(34)/5-carboxymethylaminomethyluridine(34)-2'-O)-methyltransferase TrmL [Ignatzschineria cameli]PWD88367.1 tRNA (uridine(34)/cytosine(34)/5-carboxymethylaminomethyluridine(34)-2'-O)-methyltransferase TrmL [Ignatzschineria cameli]PWD88826.1 tRNA (uridine(34)/c